MRSLVSTSAALAVVATLSSHVAALPQVDTSTLDVATVNGVTGPVMPNNFPDPCIFKAGNTWYAFATSNSNSPIHVQGARSSNGRNWQFMPNFDAMPALPAWVYPPAPLVWAPDVQHLPDGSWVLYFSAATKQDPSKHCIGAAKSNSPTGPYRPMAQPMACPLARGGAIDSSGFVDPRVALPALPSKEKRQAVNANDVTDSLEALAGTRYVVYKIDGTSIDPNRVPNSACVKPPYKSTALMLQQVGADGVTNVGNPTQILDHNDMLDAGIVEAPQIVRTQTGYILLFSTDCFQSRNYTTSYAHATNVRGPYTRRGALLRTNQRLLSPGGAQVSADKTHIVFHADKGSAALRQMYVAKTQFPAKGGIILSPA